MLEQKLDWNQILSNIFQHDLTCSNMSIKQLHMFGLFNRAFI